MWPLLRGEGAGIAQPVRKGLVRCRQRMGMAVVHMLGQLQLLHRFGMPGCGSARVESALTSVVSPRGAEQSSRVAVPGGGWAGGRVQVQAAGWEVPTGIGLCDLGPGFGKVAHRFGIAQCPVAFGLGPVGRTPRGLGNGVDVAVPTLLLTGLQGAGFALRAFHERVPILL